MSGIAVEQKDPAIMELEGKIQERIYKDNKRTTHFSYNTSVSRRNPEQVVVTTLNTQTGETFVLRVEEANSKYAALKAVVHYLDTIKPTESSYTFKWARKGAGEPVQISYFYGQDFLEVTEKFYAGKRREEYVVFSADMNPTE